MRYNQVLQICADRKPKAILEVGTYNGKFGVMMLEASGAGLYTGFDLFEEGTPEIDAAEFNLKRRVKFSEVKGYMEAAAPTAKIELIKGNTWDTLLEFVQRQDATRYDLAFIDGGHSIATIGNDWDYVKEVMSPTGVVLFDDFYTGRDTTRMGCNRIVEHLPFSLLTTADSVVVNEKKEGAVQIAIVEMADALKYAHA